jgi:hypothetical protein
MARKGKEVVFAEVAPDLKRRLKRAAQVLTEIKPAPVDMSDIVREALDEKLDRLERKHPELVAA